MSIENGRFLLVSRPAGRPSSQDFCLVHEGLPSLGDGEFLVRNHFASLDPAMRGWMDDLPSYLPPIALGDPVRAGTIGIIVESKAAAYPSGRWVAGLHALEHYSVGSDGGTTRLIEPAAGVPITNYLSILGGVGLTAYFGLFDECNPKTGDTVLISGAAGAVGSLVGQMARLAGCQVIGIAGGKEKCGRIVHRYGFHCAIDYKGKSLDDLAQSIRQAAPDGVDIVFENVGGVILDAALLNLRKGARVALCGLISEYNGLERVGARNLWSLIPAHASIRGVLATEFIEEFPAVRRQLEKWLIAGQLKIDEHIETGLENAYPAFMRLFDGSNNGKMLLKMVD
ncbi:MAG: NADP-dependent oxidoreductase [Sphingomonadales bacterium]|jgi:NADPH-dependent curcumin reductase CurA